MKPIQEPLLALLLLLLPLPAAAQDASGPVAIVEQGDRLHASGPAGSAAFELDAVRFGASPSDPLVDGADLVYRTESISVGTTTLDVPMTAVRPVRDGRFVEYGRGNAVVERYEARGDGIEQTFVFHELPERGELVVRGRLHTSLEVVRADPDAGIVFANGLRYGGVTGIDADGRSVRGTIRLEGDSLELALPADFVAEAALPLVLDPLVGSVIGPIVRTDFAEGDVDVAYANSRYLVVWRDVDDRGANPDYHSVSGIWLNAAGTPVSSAFAIWTNQALDVVDVSCGVMQTSLGKRFVVAWSRFVGLTRDVEARVFAANQTTVGPHVVLGNTIWNEVRPDVTKDSDGPATIVWERLGILLEGATIDVNGAGTPFVVDSFEISSNGDDRRPAIACAEDQKLVVWHRDNDGTVTEQIMGRRWSGTAGPMPADAEFEIDSGTLGYEAVDCAAAKRDDFFVVWDYGYLGSGGDFDVYGRRVFFPAGDGTLPTVGARKTIEFDGVESHFDPRIMFTGDAYLVSYQTPLSGNFLLQAEALDTLSGNTLDTFSLAYSPTYGGHALAPVQPVPVDNDRGMAVWSVSSVWGHRFEGSGGLAETIDAGCPVRGGEVRTSTLTSPNDSFRVELWGGEPVSGAYLAIGDAALELPIGGALLVPDPSVTASYFVGFTSLDGYAGLDLPIPAGLVGAKAWMQWIVLAPGSTCVPYPVNLSDGLLVLVD